MNHDDARFDAAMRTLHVRALDRVSPQVRQRLRAGRKAPARAPRVPGWGLASGVAALFGLVLALQLDSTPPPAHVPAPMGTEAATIAGPAGDMPVALAALEQTPDFYLWLASDDSALPPPLE